MVQLIAPDNPSEVTINLPLSKSVANRMLCIRHLANSSAQLQLPVCEDTRLMQELLLTLRKGKSPKTFDAGDAGTVFRFLTALLSVTPGEWTLTGSPRMMQRPNGPLIQALRSLGADIRCVSQEGFAPLRITGKTLEGGVVEIEAWVSSQFITAIMMIGPAMSQGVEIKFKGRVVSAPYIALTAGLMQKQGVKVNYDGQMVKVLPGNYQSFNPYAESDWSAASYWYALALLSDKSRITLSGLQPDSLQGDKVVEQIFSELGIESTWNDNKLHLNRKKDIPGYFSYDFTDCPDIVPAIAIACAGAGIRSHLTGLSTLSLKESDRLNVISSGLTKLGFNCKTAGNDQLVIEPGRTKTSDNRVETYQDHRIAMSFAMLTCKTGPLLIQQPSVVEKSYPEFWKHLEEAGFGLVFRENAR